MLHLVKKHLMTSENISAAERGDELVFKDQVPRCTLHLLCGLGQVAQLLHTSILYRCYQVQSIKRCSDSDFNGAWRKTHTKNKPEKSEQSNRGREGLPTTYPPCTATFLDTIMHTQLCNKVFNDPNRASSAFTVNQSLSCH